MSPLSTVDKTIDVKQFFSTITQGYVELTQIIKQFSAELPQYTPQQISDQCDKIQNKKNELSLLDEQLYQIINLTGTEIKDDAFVNDYRKAFKLAISATDDLHTNLQLTKYELITPLSTDQVN